MWSRKSQNLELFSERISSMKKHLLLFILHEKLLCEVSICCLSKPREHVDDISFRELFFSFSFFSFTEYDLCVPKTSICIYVGHAFYMKHSWTNSFNFLFVCLLKRAMSSTFSCLNSNNWTDGHELTTSHTYNHI